MTHVVENTDGEFVASFATKLLADFFVSDGGGCYRHRVEDNSSDRDVAIGEHAFRAGWMAHAERTLEMVNGVPCRRVPPQSVDGAWSEYEPPSDLCGG